jgi:amidase
LRDAGHEIVDWKITAEDIQEIMAVAGLLFADGGHWIHKIVTPTGEPISPDMAWYGKGKAKTIFELHEMHILRDNVRMKWFEKWNAIGGLDGLLCKGPEDPPPVEHALIECSF